MYDPVKPQIAEASVCKDIFVRAYAEPKNRKRRRAENRNVRRARKRPKSWLDGRFFVFDTETVNHELTFGAFEFYDRKKRVARGVFYADKLPTDDPAGFGRLQTICREASMALYSLAYVFNTYIWQFRKIGGTVSGFNVNYDFSKISSGWRAATAGSRRGAAFVNGFALTRAFDTALDEKGTPMLDESGQLLTRTVEVPFVRIKRDDRHHVRYDMRKAHVLDVAQFAPAITDKNYSLESTCHAFGIEFKNRPGEHAGTITPENVAGCLYDVAKTSELLYAVGREYDRHPVGLPPWQVQSGASIAKAYYRAFGVASRTQIQPDFSKELQGQAASGYFGGRVENRIVDEPMPCVYLDAVSMYPTAFTLLDLWFGLVIPERLKREELNPQQVQALLQRSRVNPKLLLDPMSWPGLAFFAEVDPNGATLPSRPNIPSPYLMKKRARGDKRAADTDDATHRLVSIGPVSSNVPLWYAGPDLAAAMILGPRAPRVIRAWRLLPVGIQSALKSVRFRGEDEINPRTTNPLQRLIELRKHESGDKLDDALRSTGYKVIANSGAYGVFAETTPEDVDPDLPRPQSVVDVWGLHAFQTMVERPESHGAYCFFPIASLVTAGARLLLAVGQRLVQDAGGEIAYCDTDSLAPVATENGDFVPCKHGPYRMPDGTRAVRALSWREVDSILEELKPLNVYDVPGSSFKLEGENFDENHRRRQLWFYGVREKSYALYALNDNGEPRIAKHSAHTIGLYNSPISGDRKQRWIADAWMLAVRRRLGFSVEEPDWLDLPALSQLTLTTYSVMKPYANMPGIHPFDFVAVAQVMYPGLLRCCKAPRPSCPLFNDPHNWSKQLWRCLGCGAPISLFIPGTKQPLFKTYRRVVAQLTQAIELKRLPANGAEPDLENMRGLTIPRPVRVASITHIGKEIVADPTDTREGLTAELLDATRPVEYRDPDERLEVLRTRIKTVGGSFAARISGVSRSQIKAFVNQGKTPRASTIRKLEAALQ